MNKMAKTYKIDIKKKKRPEGRSQEGRGVLEGLPGKFRASGSCTSTQAKNEFGQVLEQALREGPIVITKHDTPKAVLISIEEYSALSRRPEAQIDKLSSEFDMMLTRMQRPGAREAMDAAFHATPEQLGRAAVAAARKRK